MRYFISVNGIRSIETLTRDLATFIARKLKDERPENEVIIYKITDTYDDDGYAAVEKL